MSEKKNNPFIGRTDGYVDTPVVFDNPVQEHWVLIERPRKTGDGPDDWIMEKVPVKTGEENVDALIQERVKGTDLRSLVEMCLRTGDESPLNVKSGVFADTTGYPEDSIEAHNAIIKGEQILFYLPEELKKLSKDELSKLSKEEIAKYVESIIEKQFPSKENTVAAEGTTPNEGGDN